MVKMKETIERKEKRPGFWRTWKEVMFHPTAFYQQLPKTTSYRSSSVFFLKTQALSILIFYLIFAISLIVALNSENSELAALIGGIAGVGFLVGLIALLPLALLASWGFLFLGAGLVHLFVLLFGGKQGYKETFAVIAYSIAPSIFLFIQYLSFPVSIYSLILEVIGIHNRQKLSMGVSAAVVLIPFLILLIPVFIVAAYFARMLI